MNLDELVDAYAATEPLYWETPYAQTFEARVVQSAPDGRRGYLVLDRTLFHPKLGGQPPDGGRIEWSGGTLAVMKVIAVRNVVVHWGSVDGRLPLLGAEARGSIDWDRRYLYMRRHAAAHLLDHCLSRILGGGLEPRDSWLGGNCYVAYAGSPPTPPLLERVQLLAAELIREQRQITERRVPYAEALATQRRLLAAYRVPPVEEVRFVEIAGCDPIPCAGTHVRGTREIGAVRIERVEPGAGGFRLYFDVASA